MSAARAELGPPVPSIIRTTGDDLVGELVDILDPVTGEEIPLDGTIVQLAASIYRMRELKTRIDEAIKVAGEELLRRQDLEAKWTTRAGPLVIEGSSPRPQRVIDAVELYNRLTELSEAGTITAAAVSSACEIVTSVKAKVAGVNALQALGGDVAAAVDSCITLVPPSRSAPSVKLA